MFEMGIDSHLPFTSSLVFRTRVQQVEPVLRFRNREMHTFLAYHLNQSTNENHSILVRKELHGGTTRFIFWWSTQSSWLNNNYQKKSSTDNEQRNPELQGFCQITLLPKLKASNQTNERQDTSLSSNSQFNSTKLKTFGSTRDQK